MSSFLRCAFCQRDDFTNQRGLVQHQQRNETCHRRMSASLKMRPKTPAIAHDFMQMSTTIKKKTPKASQNIGMCFSPANEKNPSDNTAIEPNTNKRQFTVQDSSLSVFGEELDEEEDVFDTHFDGLFGDADFGRGKL